MNKKILRDNLGFTVTMDIYTVNLRDIRLLKDLLNARTPFDSCTVELSCKQKHIVFCTVFGFHNHTCSCKTKALWGKFESVNYYVVINK